MRHRLTGRGAVLAVSFLLFGVAVAVPLRDLVEQRAEIAVAQEANERRRAAVSALTESVQRWQDPAYVAAQARLRLHYVLPGETAVIVIDDTGKADEPAVTDSPDAMGDPFPLTTGLAVVNGDSWYERMWLSFDAVGGVGGAQ